MRAESLEQQLVESAKTAPHPVAAVTLEVLTAATAYGPESLVSVALARLIRAILAAASRMEKGLIDVVSAPSDLQAILLFLEEPTVIEELSKIDPLAQSRLRGILKKAELYQAEGGCVSAEEAAKLIGVSRQAIDKARKRGDVLALPKGQDGWTYPIWQFEGGHYLSGLTLVTQTLKVDGPFVQASFLLGKHARLEGQSPLSCLKKGRLEEVREAVEAYGNHGGS
jgi:hypothetical protein